jgi:hypothetical protein
VFLAYTVPQLVCEGFRRHHGRLNVLVAGINTILLLTSSMTMMFAIRRPTGHSKALFSIWRSQFYAGFMASKPMSTTRTTRKACAGRRTWSGAIHDPDHPEVRTRLDEQWAAKRVAPQRIRLFMTFYFA